MLAELRGKEASVNYSPTMRAKLVEIFEDVCSWEVTPNPWSDEGNEMVGIQFLLPYHISENCFFGV
jgi:hypothetical protein